MQYRRYGKTGLRISALTFGSMRIPFNEEKATADGGATADDGTPAEAADGGTTTAGSSSPMPDPSDDSEEGDDRLNAMMNLLDTHDDKWREASKEDARYEVDMPDGTTQYVQTKDDVRAHLFKNY